MNLSFHCGGGVGHKFPLRYERKVEVRGERARNGACGYGKNNCFMFETFLVKIKIDLKSSLKDYLKMFLVSYTVKILP